MMERSHSNVKFVTAAILKKRHMNRHVVSVHEGKKPFKCEICDYSCSLKRTLKKHVAAVHEGEKPI